MAEVSRTPGEQILAQQRTIVDATKRIKDLELWEKFAAHLVNHCVGQTITPENLEQWMEDCQKRRTS